MTKKHFNELAKQLHYCMPPAEQAERHDAWLKCVAYVAAACKQFNPAFSVTRFHDACVNG